LSTPHQTGNTRIRIKIISVASVPKKQGGVRETSISTKLKRTERKAVSPVIAALLLIAISVAAAVLTYSWVMSMVRTQGAQAQTAIQIDEVLFAQDGTNDYLKINIRNTGSVAAKISTIYLYQEEAQIVKWDLTTENVIAAGDTRYFGITDSTNWDPTVMSTPETYKQGAGNFSDNLSVSTAYTVKVVTDNGFAIEGTYYTPSAF